MSVKAVVTFSKIPKWGFVKKDFPDKKTALNALSKTVKNFGVSHVTSMYMLSRRGASALCRPEPAYASKKDLHLSFNEAISYLSANQGGLVKGWFLSLPKGEGPEEEKWGHEISISGSLMSMNGNVQRIKNADDGLKYLSSLTPRRMEQIGFGGQPYFRAIFTQGNDRTYTYPPEIRYERPDNCMLYKTDNLRGLMPTGLAMDVVLRAMNDPENQVNEITLGNAAIWGGNIDLCICRNLITNDSHSVGVRLRLYGETLDNISKEFDRAVKD